MSDKKLCALVKKGVIKEDRKQYRDLVTKAHYLCKRCGRVAQKAKNLCKPTDL